jgi:intein/homing endonuclease
MENSKNYFFLNEDVIVHQKNNKWKHVYNFTSGDELVFYNEDVFNDNTSVVIDIDEIEINSFLVLNLKNGVTLTTIPTQSFYIIDRGWILGSNLEVGYDCIKVDGYRSTIVNLEIITDTKKMYRLELNRNNLYANGLLIQSV